MKESLWSFTPKVNISSQKLCYFNTHIMRTTFLQHYLCPPLPSCLSSGDKLCSAEDCIPGTGVYLRHGYIYSSLAGYVLRKNEGEEVRGVVGESCRSKQACRSARGKVLSNICECDWPVIVCSAPAVKYGPYFVWQVFSLFYSWTELVLCEMSVCVH